jgi:hypothetical protein
VMERLCALGTAHYGAVTCNASRVCCENVFQKSVCCEKYKYLDDTSILEEGVQYHLTALF